MSTDNEFVFKLKFLYAPYGSGIYGWDRGYMTLKEVYAELDKCVSDYRCKYSDFEITQYRKFELDEFKKEFPRP